MPKEEAKKGEGGKRNPADVPPIAAGRHADGAGLDGKQLAGAGQDGAGQDTMSPREMMGAAWKKMTAGDYPGAIAILDKVKEKSPEQEKLWEMYGYIAARQSKMDEAKEDYRKEIAAHPDNENAVTWLAEWTGRIRNNAEAVQIIAGYADRHPEELTMWFYLASLQVKAQDNAGALQTLEKAAKAHPESGLAQVELSQALLRMDRRDEAAAAAKSALDGLGADSDDANLMNSAADVLANLGLDLGMAEAASRKSIGLLEAKSAAITTTEVNSKSFFQANLLIAAWDTLGWVLFQEGKVEEAKPWIEAAWRNNLDIEVGYHLGQVYEASEEKDAALRAYMQAAATTERASRDPEMKKKVTEAVARMKKAGGKPDATPAVESLQAMRAYKIAGPAVPGWGTFRLQVTATGVIGAQQMSGEPKLASVATAIDAMKLTELLPAGSKAHLLRSAVVSCSSAARCDLVMVPNSSMQTEQY